MAKEGYLVVYYGPMFSEKTSTLSQKLNRYSDLGYKTCYITSTIDTRSGSEDVKISTHCSSGSKLSPSIIQKSFERIADIRTLLDDYDVFGVDEAQFFRDLMLINEYVNRGKVFIVAGLDLDANQNIWGDILKLSSFANKAKKLYARCKLCLESGMIVKAPFSSRITPSTNQIDIGNNNKYMALCRKHWNQHNRVNTI